MGRKSKLRAWLLRINVAAIVLGAAGSVASNPATAPAAMSSGEVSTLHMALFIATVWIVSRLRVHRLKTFWRVGLRLMRTRGPSGYLLPRGPKARAAAGGSVSGAGASGVS
ncbi:hypothetical protein RFM41_21200 [Mesorhizobium sp. VK25A]|uniref:Uncharacterized protein n=1 Tax=Mesorhizobium vachelliae TaxID=3072309 RepID=A0ABU5A7L0_9HYPH|nr:MULTISPECIES: hypothetical protein [unclassified Mesorhizobium]MDX8533684.1 hypothetical protein [Mesorhizobium sp. VK25D]MDX8546279.1 hypothetical protein [Mesorhizobium sp. VK25A]